MKITDIDLELAKGCSVGISGRISLELASKLKRSGIPKSEAIRRGVEMVLGIGPAPEMVLRAVDADPYAGASELSREVSLKHIGYLETSESMSELEKNWADYVIEHPQFEDHPKIMEETYLVVKGRLSK